MEQAEWQPVPAPQGNTVEHHQSGSALLPTQTSLGDDVQKERVRGELRCQVARIECQRSSRRHPSEDPHKQRNCPDTQSALDSKLSPEQLTARCRLAQFVKGL